MLEVRAEFVKICAHMTESLEFNGSGHIEQEIAEAQVYLKDI